MSKSEPLRKGAFWQNHYFEFFLGVNWSKTKTQEELLRNFSGAQPYIQLKPHEFINITHYDQRCISLSDVTCIIAKNDHFQ